MLWDKETRRIVNNSEDDICLDVFRALGNRSVELFPKDIEAEHAEICAFLYNYVNNGVYRAGFATKQGPTRKLVAR